LSYGAADAYGHGDTGVGDEHAYNPGNSYRDCLRHSDGYSDGHGDYHPDRDADSHADADQLSDRDTD
jgi:hypothetical protein